MGVPQGSILGPLLFTINNLVNMIFHLCDGVKTLMYADDPVLYLHVKDLEQIAAKLTLSIQKVPKSFIFYSE